MDGISGFGFFFPRLTYRELLVLIGDAGPLVDGVDVVGEERVAAVLGDDAEGDEDGEAPAVAPGADEVEVAGGAGDVLLDIQRLLDLAVLELHEEVVAAAAGVVLGEDVEGLAVPVLGHEVPRALGDPVDEEDLHEGRQDLQQRDGPPGPVALHPRRAPAYPGDLRKCELGSMFGRRGRARWDVIRVP